MPAAEIETPDDAIALTMGSPLVHFAGFEAIEDKRGQLLRDPLPSKFQAKIATAYEWCIANGIAPRLIAGPKARQSYGSTICCEIAYHHTRRFRVSGLVMADEGDRTKLLWRMLERFAANDDFSHYWGNTWSNNSIEATIAWVDEDEQKKQQTRKAYWAHETASDPQAGSAGTRHVLWFSEAGLYEKDPNSPRQDAKVIGNALNSVPPGPNTLIIMESVAGGPEGYFYETCMEAVTLEERMAGKVGNGWIKIFCAWHECTDYQLELNDQTRSWFDNGDERFTRLKAREEAGRQAYGWTINQIAWRRQKIVQDLKWDESTFDREFPESEERAFAASANMALDPEGLAALVSMSANVSPQYGVLTEHSGRQMIVFIPTIPDQANYHIWENPFERARYIVCVDTKTDRIDASGTSDCNSALVLRDAVMDVQGRFHPVMLSARVTPENRMDAKLFAWHVAMLARYYGDCTIVVEANAGGGVIRELLELGCNVLRRPQPNKSTTRPSTEYGWWSSDVTRRVTDAELQSYVREQTIVIKCQHVVSELLTLVIDDLGKIVASGKRHDDDALALSIGLACLRSASSYNLRKIPKPRAPDERRWKKVSSF